MTNEQQDYIRSSIVTEKTLYNVYISNEQYDNAFSALNNIIELKKLINYRGSDSVYLDYKKYFHLYLKAINEKESGYDHVSLKTIVNKIKFVEPDKRVDLLLIFKRVLALHGYLEESNDCDHYIHKSKYEHLLSQPFSLKKVPVLVVFWSSIRVRNLLILLVIFYLLANLILWPAPIDSWQLISEEKKIYSSSTEINHFINVLTLFFDLDGGMKVDGLNIWGVILIIAGKVSYVAVLLNFIVKNLLKYLKISE